MASFRKTLAILLVMCMLMTSALPALAAPASGVPETEKVSLPETGYEKAVPADPEGTAVFETVADGVRITVTADAGVFPEGAVLWAEKVEDAGTAEAIDRAIEELNEGKPAGNITSRLQFDIKMFFEGNEIQPDPERGSVSVSFALPETVSESTDIHVYHVTGEGGKLEAETLDAMKERSGDAGKGKEPAEGTVITSEIPGFSYYVLQSIYDYYRYTLNNANKVKLSRILFALQISGIVSKAESTNPELFTVEKDQNGGDWTVTAVGSAETAGTLKVTTDHGLQEISITVSNPIREQIEYVDTDGNVRIADCILLENADDCEFQPGEWYAVNNDVRIQNRITNRATIDEPSHLIIGDDAKLTVRGGIQNGADAGIEIYGQENNSGELFLESVPSYCACIGGNPDESNGSILINGGRIKGEAGIFAAGIGAGMNGRMGTIVIRGGWIDVTGGGAGAGIGGGIQCPGGSIVITGGTIKAKGGNHVAAAIGGGIGSESNGDLEIDDDAMIIRVGDKVKTCKEYASSRDNQVEITLGAEYRVRHHYQKVDGTGYEEPEVELRHGHPGRLTTAVPRTQDGFTWRNFEQEPINENGNTVINIYYDRDMCFVIFDANGHGIAPNRISALFGSKISAPPEPTAVGFEFGGWYTDIHCTQPYVFDKIQAGSIILFAKWVITTRKYHITWMLNDIKMIDSTDVLEGEMPVHAIPTMDDSVFVRWEPEIVPAVCDTRYVAYFERRGERMAVSFNTNGSNFIDTQLVERDTRAVRPEDPQKDGCTFEGWYREYNFVTPYDFDDPVNADIILYAKWRTNPPDIYALTWKMDDDTVIDMSAVMAGEMPVHTPPSKEGYTFIGWEPALEPATKAATYTAKFEKKVPEKVAVSFNTDGGNYIDTQVIVKGSTAARPGTDPVKTEYTFAGWYQDAACTERFEFSQAITADTVVYAKWTKNTSVQYTVTWRMDDSSLLGTTTVNAGEMPSHTDPEKSGFIFTGWTPALAPVTGDITYTAKFEKKVPGKVAVSFNTDGGSYIDTQVIMTGGTAARPGTDPVKTGYTFAGWYKDAACTEQFDFSQGITADTAVYAKWSRNASVRYTVTWRMDDMSLLGTTTVNAGEMPVHTDPEKPGSVFTGWTPALAPVTGDITYTAKFVQLKSEKAAVSFNTTGGSYVETQMITLGEKATKPAADPTREGYTFAGWYTDVTYSKVQDFNTPITANTVIAAKWDRIPPLDGVRLCRIEITAPPSKTVYEAGEIFSQAGMTVTAYYNDNTSANVFNYQIVDAHPFTPEDMQVTVRYTEKGITREVKQAVRIKTTAPSPFPMDLYGIVITTQPDKVTYNEGESFDRTGMTVKALYSRDISGYSLSPLHDLRQADQKITVIYTENGVTKTADQPITVHGSLGPYVIIRGANQVVLNNADSAVFSSNADFSKFVRVEVDGKEVPSQYYTAKSGSTVITFKRAYISTLKEGSHTLRIVSVDGSASTGFLVRSVPDTGDSTNPVLMLMLLLASTGTLLGMAVKARKRN